MKRVARIIAIASLTQPHGVQLKNQRLNLLLDAEGALYLRELFGPLQPASVEMADEDVERLFDGLIAEAAAGEERRRAAARGEKTDCRSRLAARANKGQESLFLTTAAGRYELHFDFARGVLTACYPGQFGQVRIPVWSRRSFEAIRDVLLRKGRRDSLLLADRDGSVCFTEARGGRPTMRVKYSRGWDSADFDFEAGDDSVRTAMYREDKAFHLSQGDTRSSNSLAIALRDPALPGFARTLGIELQSRARDSYFGQMFANVDLPGPGDIVMLRQPDGEERELKFVTGPKGYRPHAVEYVELTAMKDYECVVTDAVVDGTLVERYRIYASPICELQWGNLEYVVNTHQRMPMTVRREDGSTHVEECRVFDAMFKEPA